MKTEAMEKEYRHSMLRDMFSPMLDYINGHHILPLFKHIAIHEPHIFKQHFFFALLITTHFLSTLLHSHIPMNSILFTISTAASVVGVAWAAHYFVATTVSVEDMEALPMIQMLCRERTSAPARCPSRTHTKKPSNATPT